MGEAAGHSSASHMGNTVAHRPAVCRVPEHHRSENTLVQNKFRVCRLERENPGRPGDLRAANALETPGTEPFPTSFLLVLRLAASGRRLGQDRCTGGDLVSHPDGAPFTMKDLTRPKQRFQPCLG